jgi:nicotinate-nucleotide pyrophosphorylase (carboxylating)
MILSELIKAALKEDMPTGDLTTESLALPPRFGKARVMAKQDLILSGTAVFEQTVHLLEQQSKIKWHFDDGSKVLKNQNICTIQGDLIQILKAERVALNFMQHLSGIATMTRSFVEKVIRYNTIILDTRKTTPGYREIEKRAVQHGGGKNHRMNLSQAILIKDNHIAVMGGISKAVKRIRENCDLPIEIEAGTLEEVNECVILGANRILLDNMNNEMLKSALDMIPDSIEVEASGNMTIDRVESVAELGVDFISVGALTHSAPSADMSMLFDWHLSSN